MKIVIIGGGFAGINLAKKLSNKPGVEVVLVDTNNYNFFPPLIYQVASSFIEESNISLPFRRMFQKSHNVNFFNATLLNIVKEDNTIVTTNGDLTYDYLVLAMGTETNYFGMENVKKNSYILKSIDDALELKNRLLENLEKACRTQDPEERKKLMTLVISGGGPTGVEISGMLAEMETHIKDKDYPELKGFHSKIILVDAGPSLLGPMSKKSQNEALAQLQKLGVEVKLNVAVKDFDGKTVFLADGTTIETTTLVWVSGVIAREAKGLPENVTGRGRRILVDGYNKVNETENIYAIGDISYMSDDTTFPNGHPQLAQVAIQQGALLAKNFIRLQNNETLKPFKYLDKGSMAIITKHKAVVDFPNKWFMKGYFAWLTWLFIHIMPIAGFRNRVNLFFSWLWSFITNNPTIRLIIKAK